MAMNESAQPLLRWRSDLGVTPTTDRDGDCVHVEDPVRRKFFRIGASEFALLSDFDGQRPTAEVIRSVNQQLGQREFSLTDAVSIVQWGLRSGLLTLAGGETRAVVQESRRPANSLLSIRIPLGSLDHWCERVLPWTNWLFGSSAFVVWLALVLMAAYQVLLDWDRFRSATAELLVPSNWWTLGLAWLVLKVLHEFAHGLVCKRYGGDVPQAGVALIFFAPVAFVDVTSSWRFPSRWQRIHTAVAGIYVEVAVASLAILAASCVESRPLHHLLDNVAVMASLTTLLFNINPLSRFDGYYILSDLCEVPNLYARGRVALRQFVRRCLLGPQAVAERPSWLLAGYGLATFLWGLTVLFGLTIAAAYYWHGLGLMLSFVIVINWLRPTLAQGLRSLQTTRALPVEMRRRLVCRSALLTGAAVVVLRFVPWPFVTTAPGLVEFSPMQVVRAESSAFVDRVFVQDGERVEAGQPLLELRNDDLKRERDDLELEIEQSLCRERLAAEQHDIAACQIEQQQREALRRRWAERQRQVERLTVTAPMSGVVVGRQLRFLPGAFVKEGQELLTLGEPTHREFTAVVAQEHALAVQETLAQPVTIVLTGRGSLTGHVQKIHPRAAMTTEHLCLCAPYGGTLPVRLLGEQERGHETAPSFELLQPHFRVTISIDAPSSERLAAGELGWINLGRSQTCGQQLWSWLSRWVAPHSRNL
jgi:putative peptide zinc metalloprotease protein